MGIGHYCGNALYPERKVMDISEIKGCHFSVDRKATELHRLEEVIGVFTGMYVKAEYSRDWSHKHRKFLCGKNRYNDFIITYRLSVDADNFQNSEVHELMYLVGNNRKYIVITGINK